MQICHPPNLLNSGSTLDQQYNALSHKEKNATTLDTPVQD
jgi:hypothetical protein